MSNQEITPFHGFMTPCCNMQVESAEELGLPTFECSRCGNIRVEDESEDRQRCEDCHIFMAKNTPYSCPSCEQPIEDEDDLEVVEGFMVEGNLFPTEIDAQAWIDDTPERERREAKQRRIRAERDEQERKARIEEAKADAVKVAEILTVFPEDSKTADTIRFVLPIFESGAMGMSINVQVRDFLVLNGYDADEVDRSRDQRGVWAEEILDRLGGAAEYRSIGWMLASGMFAEAVSISIEELHRFITNEIKKEGR